MRLFLRLLGFLTHLTVAAIGVLSIESGYFTSVPIVIFVLGCAALLYAGAKMQTEKDLWLTGVVALGLFLLWCFPITEHGRFFSKVSRIFPGMTTMQVSQCLKKCSPRSAMDAHFASFQPPIPWPLPEIYNGSVYFASDCSCGIYVWFKNGRVVRTETYFD
jgi:hypothetical protein